MNEIWKDVIGYNGIYQVSNIGRIKSLRFNKEKILKLSLNKGYYVFELSKDKIKKQKKVHQVVAESFLGHVCCGMKLVVDHINDIKNDNRVDNLQIVSNRFNSFKKQENYSSQFKGVSWHTKREKWQVQIQINGKRKHLGTFINEYEAHLTYQNALIID